MDLTKVESCPMYLDKNNIIVVILQGNFVAKNILKSGERWNLHVVLSRGQNRKLLQACGLWLHIYETSPPPRKRSFSAWQRFS